jgi:hypothetical protein
LDAKQVIDTIGVSAVDQTVTFAVGAVGAGVSA